MKAPAFPVECGGLLHAPARPVEVSGASRRLTHGAGEVVDRRVGMNPLRMAVDEAVAQRSGRSAGGRPGHHSPGELRAGKRPSVGEGRAGLVGAQQQRADRDGLHPRVLTAVRVPGG